MEKVLNDSTKDVESLRMVVIDKVDNHSSWRAFGKELLLNAVCSLLFGGLLIVIDITIFNIYFWRFKE